MTYLKITLIAGLAVTLTACASTPEPEAPPVEVNAPPVQTCVPLSSLKRVVVPAVVKKFTAITEIENPPYEPIQRKEEITRVVTPEVVYYVDDSGAQVTDICDAPDTPETMG